jgi:hypothetical protein
MFALEIEAENPDAGELTTSAPGQVSQDRVAQIFNTVILGGMVNLAAGSPGTSQQLQVAVVPGDFASLVEWLRLTGVPEDELAELSGVMDKDQATVNKSIGQRTKDWIAKAAGKVAGAGGRITESSSGTAGRGDQDLPSWLLTAAGARWSSSRRRSAGW